MHEHLCTSFSKTLGCRCSDDDEPVFLSQRGVVKCRSGDHQGELCRWGWNCESEYHKGKYNDNTVDNDCEGYIFALSMAVQLVGTMGSEWVAELISSIGKQYKH
ncbi:hypothetical protein DPMN_161392 [Dreissena polymorpha]|uniref:Uncharacterized protein n=1 Tax=Dreissena polymorpha TaxID=45954 RepID=A0A9D4ISK4_DREPO|nr:hypothetical protein DPMN_161392 [Dreissena polymorpha]